MNALSLIACLIGSLCVLTGYTQRMPAEDLLWFMASPKAEAVWAPFGEEHDGAVRFQAWVKKSQPQTSLIPFDNRLVLNCWEYVLYTALKMKTLTIPQVQSIYDRTAGGESLSAAFGATVGTVPYQIENERVTLNWSFEPRAGDIILMDEASHVVQATGGRDPLGRVEVISFSPRPIWGDGSRYWPEPNTQPEVTTLESLIEELIVLYPDVPTDWNQIELKVVRPDDFVASDVAEQLSKKTKISLAQGTFQVEVRWKKAQQTSDEIDVLFGRVEFFPKKSASFSSCKNVSFVQTARILDNNGADYSWPLGQTARNLIRTKANARGVVGGYFIDHDASKCIDTKQCSPFFRDSWPNTQDGSRDGSLSSRGAKPVVLVDYPYGWEFISSAKLEACAVCRTDARILGCATWGGEWPMTGERFVFDIEAADSPSATFLDAVRRFKAHYRQ